MLRDTVYDEMVVNVHTFQKRGGRQRLAVTHDMSLIEAANAPEEPLVTALCHIHTVVISHRPGSEGKVVLLTRLET
jgi:hypothetical protein